MNGEKPELLALKNVGLTYRNRAWGMKRFEYQALKDVTFSIKHGETLGVLGRNGCGKSSLLRILSGIIQPTEGRVECEPGASRMLLTLGLGFNGDLSGRDNAVLSSMLQGHSKKEALAHLDAIGEFSELGSFFERQVKTYSSGMRARLGFSTAIHTNVDLLLIDETLSVGDSHFKHKAQEAMMKKINSDQTVVFVSHSADQIDKVCSRAIWIEEGVVRAEGPTKVVSKEYEAFMTSLDEKDRIF